ncbi:SusC/RagA family TonB-linked outer membrane protein [Leeuwenhoekiella nanhaiensis]|uniref:SusC/RagA family TonB-linked outer membrane protein n=1 Tax=Leeuwenhoekiella nanhaiensis TaxID=1655491 RepID=A0A2G1VSW6_9FLAO|nr:TonB-dependent receptor [Leeuwenhoekiella nanhaiensis]PHQ29834.1 SusC/RagA family TonB-linked outer membrane protein [Leeuwenhoekiella nanhaiensis]
MKCKISFLLFLGLFSFSLSAQETKTITGTITDTRNVPLPGAELKVVDKDTYTVTDFDGNFSLEASVGDQIRITYLGFQSQTFSVTNDDVYTLALQDQTSELDEVVVVGYGNQKRSDITGAIVSVDSEEITKQPATTAIQSVQGKVAGVNIIANDAPGSTPTVLMRGLGTAEGGRSPLYIVDGQPLSDIRSINPNDIESIDFLKGASYANIYGIRAANGVILITTKRGKSGKPVFSFESYYGAKTILNQVKMANADQYIQYFNEESAANDGFLLQENQRYDTDWYDELLQTGLINNNSFSVSGASDNIDYFLSYNLFEEKGILDGQKFRRGTIRSNNTYHLFNDNFRIIQNLNIAYTNETPKPFGAFSSAYRQSPLVPVRYDNGLFGQSFVNEATGIVTFESEPGQRVGRLNTHANPVSQVFFEDTYINTTSLQGQIAAELDITDDLMLTTRFAATKFYSTNHSFSDIRAQWLNADPRRSEATFDTERDDPNGDGIVSTEFANNSYSVSRTESYRWNVEGFLTYTKEIDKHNISATVGLSRENYQGGEFTSSQGYDVRPERNLRNFNLRTDRLFDDSVGGDTFQSTNLQSYFGRVEYNYDSRYYLRAVLRRDGTSDFVTGDDNFFGYFPAFSLGWTLTNESFMEDNGVLDNFKLFAGWGKLGNQAIPFNVQSINSGDGSRNTNYVFGPAQSLIIGAALGTPAIPLSWEVTEEFEVGFDFAMLNRRLSGTIDYYNRLNTNAILNVRPILNSEFSSNFFDEAAEISNSGFEFLVNWRDQIGSDFSYNIGVNFSTNENRVQNVKPAYDGAIGGSLGNGRITKRLAEGQPIFAWWMYEADGVWQTQEEIDNNTSLGNARPGHLRYVDQNEDGVIDDRDKKYFGSYIPTYNYGVNIGANYKSFDLSVSGFGVGGNKVYNGLYNTRIGGENISAEQFNKRWTGPGSTNVNPGAERDVEASSYYLEDGSYFRINNITLGYTLPELSNFINSARVYVTLQNPFMFTKYTGFTPELNQNGDPTGTTGIELSAYPNTRSFILGANFKL